MFRHRSSLVRLASGATLAALALALAGCGEDPTPPRLIGFSPAVLTVPANQELAISVEYEENDFSLQDFQWTAEAGQIAGNGSPSITYRAPGQAGDYAISVTVTYGDDEAPLALDSAIEVTGAVAAEAPAVTAAPESSQDPSAGEAVPPVEQAEGAATEAEGAVEESATAAAQVTEQAAEGTTTEVEDAIEKAATATERAAEEAAPVEQAAEGAATEAEGVVEEAASATAQVAEQAAPPVERAAEGAATEAGEALDEAVAASEQAAQQATAPVVAGAGRAAASLEETATATVAAIREEGEAARAVGEEAAERVESEAAAVADQTAAAARPAGEGAAPAGAPSAAPPAGPAPETAVAALTEAAAPPGGSRLDRILDRHRLTAIVQIAFEPFSFYGEDGRRTGFEIDMMREFARRWLDDPKAVTFLPVPADARIPTLQKGRADLIAAALTETPARAEEVDLSLTYFKDGQRLLVRKGSDIAGVCDLRGRKVAAIHGSTSLDNLEAAAQGCGFALGDDLVTFRRHDEAVEALLAGEVDAFTSDGVALEGFAREGPLEVVGNHFSEEPYGLAVPKGDQRLLELVNHTLKQMEQDGTYAALYEKWFGDAIRPYPLGEPETASAGTEVAALATTSAPALIEPKAGPGAPVEAYVVQPGDTLSRIAGKVYGDVAPRAWRRIYEANRAAIGDDPSRIQVGMRLTIPQ